MALMSDSDERPLTSSSRRPLSWLLAGGVVGLVGVAFWNKIGGKSISLRIRETVVEQACASGGQPSSCPTPHVPVMTSYGAWTVCGASEGLPTQTGLFVGGIEGCEAQCKASSTCKGVQWVQGADSTQDICFEISDNICAHHTMAPPVSMNSVPAVQNAECIVKGCGGGGTACVAGQQQCCPASSKREVNVAGDKLVQRFVRRLAIVPGASAIDARVVKKEDGTIVICRRDTGNTMKGYWAIGTVSTVAGEDVTMTLNPHLKVVDQGGKSVVVRYDPAKPNNPTTIGYVTPSALNAIACPAEAVQSQGRRMICGTGHIQPLAIVDASCPWPLPDGWSLTVDANGNNPKFVDAAGTDLNAAPNVGCAPKTPDNVHGLCETQVFASADHKAVVCDTNLNVLGIVETVPVGVEVDDRAIVRLDDRNQAGIDMIVVQNPETAVGGKKTLGKVIRHAQLGNGDQTGVWSCAGITCGTTSTCAANPVLPPGKWNGLLCVGVSPLPPTLRGVFWKRNRGATDHFPFIPDLVAFCQNTDGCGKSLGRINADGELLLDLRGEKVVDWLGTTGDIADNKALTWIKENGFCKLTFTAVGGKGSRHSPTWFKIKASCDPTESEFTRRLGANVGIPPYVTSQIDAFNENEPFMVWVHGAKQNVLLPRGCTAWALWYHLDKHMSLAQDSEAVTNLEKAKSKLVSIVDDRGYTLENCGASDFARLYEKKSVIHYTYDNLR